MLLAGLAHAGSLDGEVALDALHATSTSDAPSSGPQPSLSATEIGVRVRGTVRQGLLLAGVDYWGREPVAGLFPTTTYRTFYRLEAVLGKEDGDLAVGIGRFSAPSAIMLLVDGARLAWSPGALGVELFAGRRGTSSSLRGLSPSTLLPALGAAVSYQKERGRFDANASLIGDRVELGVGEDGELLFSDEMLGVAAQARGHLRFDPLLVGASATVAPSASYTLLPAGDAPTLSVSATDLFQIYGFTSWRPSDSARLDADVLHQSATVAAGPVDADPPGDSFSIVDPTFTDLRLRSALRPIDVGWLKPDVRLRLRDRGRTELRYGSALDIDNIGIEGPIVRGKLFFDDILADGTDDDLGAVDRLLWSLSGGYSRGSIDVEAGASFIDRALAPVSSRGLSASSSDDLSPFVLEAQNMIFARGFFAPRFRSKGAWFCGTDLEISTTDPEVRAFLQLGMLAETDF